MIAVLLAGIFVVIGASILLISIKELELASGGTQSQYAFYASDTGLDCAFYWDLKHHIFASSTSNNIEPTAASNIYCAEANIVDGASWEWLAGDLGQGPSNDFTGNTIFSIDDLYPDDNSRDDCVLVYVIKKSQGGVNRTYIESRGYNTCDENNPRRVERALRATY